MAADRSVVLATVVVKNSVNTYTMAPPVGAGKQFKILTIGMADGSKGDKPSIVRIKFGGVLIRTMAATTGTVNLALDKQFEGDGVKTLTIERENAESADKVITVWVDAFER